MSETIGTAGMMTRSAEHVNAKTGVHHPTPSHDFIQSEAKNLTSNSDLFTSGKIDRDVSFRST